MKFFPVLPVIFIAAYIFVAANIAISTPKYAIIGIGAITLFMFIYFITRGMKKQIT
jgi:APA family basic amino acid/polyamine antiporter